MKNILTFLILMTFLSTSCVVEFEELGNPEIVEEEDFSFPEDFEFSTSKTVDVQIIGSGRGVVEVYLATNEPTLLGKFASSNFTQEFTIASVEEELLLVYRDGLIEESASYSVLNNSQVVWDLSQYAAPTNGRVADGSCTDHLYAVESSSGGFWKVDVSNDDYNEEQLPSLQGGGSIACALDQSNALLYYNVGKTLYKYDIYSGDFDVAFTSNPFNGNYPRLAYLDGFLYMSNGTTMYKVDASSNVVVASYTIEGIENTSGGGDLAFTADGTLYLSCFSGLYKFVSFGESIATVTRISAENFPYKLTSMAIDRQDRIFVGTNDNNSSLLEMNKVDGSFRIVKTYDHRINDLTAWKCDEDELSQTDTDSDGIIDELDDYPNDPNAAFDVFTPSDFGYGTLAFEDMWPAQGDFDFNDMVINYRFTNVLNTNNESVRLDIELKVVAAGATFANGFGIELPISGDLISSVEGDHRSDGKVVIDAKGLETGQSNAVIIPFDNVFSLFEGRSMINTQETGGYLSPVTMNISINFAEPVPAVMLNGVPYNPFIFVNGDRSREVHLKNHQPTGQAAPAFFGTGDDLTDLSLSKTYNNADNVPWAINLIHNFRFPKEQTRIDKAYNHFTQWGKSNGQSYVDWYKDNSGYRNENKIVYLP